MMLTFITIIYLSSWFISYAIKSLILLQVYSADTQYFKTIEGLTASKSNMRLQLQSVHFGGGPVMNGGGQLILRCTAQIGNFYQEYAEKELGVPQKDPIPARGETINLHNDLIN